MKFSPGMHPGHTVNPWRRRDKDVSLLAARPPPKSHDFQRSLGGTLPRAPGGRAQSSHIQEGNSLAFPYLTLKIHANVGVYTISHLHLFYYKAMCKLLYTHTHTDVVRFHLVDSVSLYFFWHTNMPSWESTVKEAHSQLSGTPLHFFKH